MRFTILVVPALVAVACGNPIDLSTGEDLFVRDEYRWCLGRILAAVYHQRVETDMTERPEN